MEAMWDCASQLWVPGRSRVHGRLSRVHGRLSRVHGRLYLNFCPNAATLQFQVWMPI